MSLIAKKGIFLSVLISIFLISCIVFFLLFRNSKKTELGQESAKPSGSFPLLSSQESLNLAMFRCTITENKIVDDSFDSSIPEFGLIQIKLLTECEYLDLNNSKKRINLITGAIYKDQDGDRLSYGGNVYLNPITDTQNVTGELILRDIEHTTKIRYKLEETPKFEKGEILTVTLSMPNNALLESNIEGVKNNNISRYTYKYMIKNWNQQQSFWNTGDPQYLPETKNGIKILPVMGIYWQK